jgi:hypothetical protein
VGPVEVAADGDAEPGAGAAAGLLGELQAQAVEGEGVVLAHGALLLVAEDLAQVGAAHGHEGAGGLRRGRVNSSF